MRVKCALMIYALINKSAASSRDPEEVSVVLLFVIRLHDLDSWARFIVGLLCLYFNCYIDDLISIFVIGFTRIGIGKCY